MNKDKLIKWLLDYKGDIAVSLSEVIKQGNLPLTNQYLEGINDTLRIVINAVQEDNFSGNDWNNNYP